MSTKQLRRPPPAYQEYASDMLADRRYRLMSLSEKGLLDVLRKECWANGCVPSNPDELARIIGIPVSELMPALTDKVRSFFEVSNGNMRSPELDAYRQDLENRREKERVGGSIGGKRSAESRRQRNMVSSPPEGSLQPTLQGGLNPGVKGLSRDKLKGVETRKGESVEEWLTAQERNELLDAFSTDYSNDASEYEIQSNGR